MSTFSYAPKVNAHIQVVNKQGKSEILDISEDLVQGSVSIRTNALHTFQFQLQNTQRKYDGVIRPMDKVVVTMQRVGAPCRVFSGYLNNGPVFSVWPRVLTLSATCTLKRLAYWYWDSGSAAAMTLLNEWANTNVQGPAAAGAGTTQTTLNSISNADGGLRDLVIALLTKVVGWPKGQIHVGEIPNDWFSFASAIGDDINKLADESKLLGQLGAGSSIGGAGSGGLSSNVQLQAGSYGGVTLNAEQAGNASIIYNVAATMKLTQHDASMGIGCAYQEAKLINVARGDRDSVGLFQQRPSQGWGTAAECQDPVHAATTFFTRLKAVPGYETMPYTQAIQAVQRSAFPNAYAPWQVMSDAVVTKLTGTANSISVAGTGGSPGSPGSPAPSGATGRNIAAFGYNLITAHAQANTPISYSLGGDDADTTPMANIKKLDCSSFVQWCYYQASNTHLARTSQDQQAACTWVVTDRSVLTNIKGAVLWNEPGHIELSLGNGWTVAAHTDGIPLGFYGHVQVGISQDAGAFTHAGLLPGVDYTDAATTQAAADALQRLTGRQHTVSNINEFPGDGSGTTQPGTAGGANTGDSAAQVFAALINIYTMGYAPSLGGVIYAGPRALMNDEQILPFVANLMQASMRSWCSAPNGDFMAWFPDYFDIWNFAAKMVIQPIELMDFTVDWSDTNIVTHQYVVGRPANVAAVDQSSGALRETGSDPGGITWEILSQGIATMDFPQIFRAIFGQDATQEFLTEYITRFGGRPNTQQVPQIQQGRPEFFMALYLFMQKWADQFTATIPVTFMPELWPGMIVQIPAFGFQAYVKNVTHNFSYGPGGSFTTQIEVCAPARMGDENKMSVFGLLPAGGKKYVATQPGGTP